MFRLDEDLFASMNTEPSNCFEHFMFGNLKSALQNFDHTEN